MRMRMRFGSGQLVAAVVALAVILGCGGGGGAAGGTTTTGGTTGGNGNTTATYPFTGTYLEFFSQTRSGSLVDPLNLSQTDLVQIQVAYYATHNNRVALPASAWTVSPAGAGVTVDSSGVLRVTGPTSGPVVVSATASLGGQNVVVRQEVNVPQDGTIVSGQLGVIGTNQFARFVQVDFFDGLGNRVGGSVTDGNGNFAARVPLSATRFQLNTDSLPTSRYFRMARYQNQNYTTIGATCRLPLPALSAGVVVLPGFVYVYPNDGASPPPAPDGCE